MHFHEDTVTTRGERGPREHWRERTIAGRFVPSTARPLNRMSCVEDDWITFFPHPVERAHVRDQIIVAERCAALGEAKFLTTERRQLVGDVLHIPWRQELPLLHVNGASCFGRRLQQIGLATQERRNLQKVDHLAGKLGFVWRMDIGRYRNFQLTTDRRENFATFARADSAKRTCRSPVRFVVGRFEDKIDIFRGADFGDPSRHLPNKLFRFNHARAENKYGAASTDGNFTHAKRFHAVGEVCSLRPRSTIANGA